MKIQVELLREFEKYIDTLKPEAGRIPIRILGYGEISMVFEILNDPSNLAYKRIPIFDNEEQVKRHEWAYNEYNRILKEEVGLNIPDYGTVWFFDERGKIQFYCVQEQIPYDSVGNRVIHNLGKKDVLTLVLLVMREMHKVWRYNRRNKRIDLGLDGQISNFAVLNYASKDPKVDIDSNLYYLDTSTPMLRINGIESMEAELLLKSAPSFLRWLLKALFLEETVGRYYDWRKVTIDLVANFFKEQKSELIPSLIKLVNQFFLEETNEDEFQPITLEEVRKYYESDAQMWDIFQNVRKLDRFLKTRIFKKQYPFYLPGEIKR